MKTVFAGILLLIMTGVPGAGIMTSEIDYKQDSTVFKSFIAYDDKITGKRPGVLVVHEWWGLNDFVREKAKALAALGYVAFAPDMYGDGKTTTSADEAGKLSGAVRADPAVLRARIAAALEKLRSDIHVDKTRIACIGYCFGGGVALELARSGADVRGVVSFHGSLATTTPATEKPKARILICHGADDTFVTMDQVAGLIEELKKVKADYEVDIYAHAVHAFSNPDADKAGLPGVAYNAEADRMSWEQMKKFLGEVLGK